MLHGKGIMLWRWGTMLQAVEMSAGGGALCLKWREHHASSGGYLEVRHYASEVGFV